MTRPDDIETEQFNLNLWFIAQLSKLSVKGQMLNIPGFLCNISSVVTVQLPVLGC